MTSVGRIRRCRRSAEELGKSVRIVQNSFQSGTDCERCKGESRKHFVLNRHPAKTKAIMLKISRMLIVFFMSFYLLWFYLHFITSFQKCQHFLTKKSFSLICTGNYCFSAPRKHNFPLSLQKSISCIFMEKIFFNMF